MENADALPAHVVALVEWSEMVDFLGLPHNVWVARELLPTTPLLHAYDGMPVVREFRCFVRNGVVVCLHPYWPLGALRQGFTDPPDDIDVIYNRLRQLCLEENSQVRALASSAGQALGGDWSVDVLETERGWYITDMAVARQSYHWDGCPNATLFERP